VNGFASFPEARAERRSVDSPAGRRIALYRLKGPRSGPAILWGHANGFAAGCYAKLLTALARDADVFAFDAAGHGGSDSAETDLPEFCAADALAADVEAVVRATKDWSSQKRIRYAAHSLCGAAMLHLATAHRARFEALELAGLMLFEPPLFPPEGHKLRAVADESQIKRLERTAARRAEFAGGPEEFAAYLAQREMFAGFPPDVLIDHARATLRPVDVTWRLACTPAMEAEMFRTFKKVPLFLRLAEYRVPPHIGFVAGDIANAKATGNWVTGILDDAAARTPGATLAVLDGRSHMMIFEDFDRSLKILAHFCGRENSRPL
jgi:pimeloyl-ACP methyl ester carboxylesterase